MEKALARKLPFFVLIHWQHGQLCSLFFTFITGKLNPIIDNDIKHLKCVFYSSVIDFSRYWRCNIWKASGINISRSLHSLLESMVMLMDKKKGLLHLISWLTANIELNKKHFGTHCTMAVLSLFTFYAPWAWNKDSKDMQEIKNLRFVNYNFTRSIYNSLMDTKR